MTTATAFARPKSRYLSFRWPMYTIFHDPSFGITIPCRLFVLVMFPEVLARDKAPRRPSHLPQFVRVVLGVKDGTLVLPLDPVILQHPVVDPGIFPLD